MKKILKWALPVVILIVLGTALIVFSNRQEEKLRSGYQTYAAAMAALESGNFKTAYELFLQSSYEFEDREMKALATYEAANIGWLGQVADYRTLVGLYKQAIRYKPGYHEAAFNLEYLYWLKANTPEQLPQPEVGPEPGREEVPESGDV
jgi:hypothetical protein